MSPVSSLYELGIDTPLKIVFGGRKAVKLKYEILSLVGHSNIPVFVKLNAVVRTSVFLLLLK